MRGHVCCILVLAALLLAAGASSAELHILLSVPGVEGTSEVKGYTDWLECASFEHNVPGLLRPMQLCSPGPTFQDGSFQCPENYKGFMITRSPDKASPGLLLFCQQGRPFRPMKLALLSVGDGDAQLIINFELQDAVIAGYTVMAPGFGDRAGLINRIPDDQPILLLKIMPKSLDWRRTLPTITH